MLKSITILLLLCSASFAGQGTFEGPWRTTNRKLDGIQTCVVTQHGPETWEGRFYGTWQGIEYDYTVKFSGSPDKLRGTAIIDGADYTWNGTISKEQFSGTFDGNRYRGSFDMKRKKSTIND